MMVVKETRRMGWPPRARDKFGRSLLLFPDTRNLRLQFHTWPRSLALAGLTLLGLAALAPSCLAQLRFQDDFEGDLSGWYLEGEENITLEDSGSKEHGRVMVLKPNGYVLALVRGSGTWGPVRMDLDVLFPDDQHNYLGLIYNYLEVGSRADFGSLYIKGNGSYIRANPWRDGNVSRLLYEEYKTPLEGDDAIQIGTWHRVRMEVMGKDCHLYVGDMEAPKVTFDLYEGDAGLVGVNPRVAGGPVWVDNVRVTSIEGLSYQGPRIPEIDYRPEDLLTSWSVRGPYRRPARGNPWWDGGGEWSRSFDADARGAVVTGRVTEYDGHNPVALFATQVDSEVAGEAILHLSTLDEMSLWVNGSFQGFVYRNGYMFGRRDWNAWYDFYRNPEHEGTRVPIQLQAGSNQIVIQVRNGQFASGGFFAHLERRPRP